MISKQETFDTVARHLFKQGRRAVKGDPDGRSMCMYRAPDGSSCAAGCLIPDEEYDPAFDVPAKNFSGSGVCATHVRPYFESKGFDMFLLVDLQRAHDNADDRNFLPDINIRLRMTANAHGLDTAVLDELVAAVAEAS